MTVENLVARCAEILDLEWNALQAANPGAAGTPFVDDEALRGAIEHSVNSRTKTYRYVLPTQLVAKLVDPSLDCRCLQASRGGAGAFDARTVAHKVVVPFDQRNERVLGGSSEPYVNNPLRVGEITAAHRSAQKDRQGWDDLCLVLEMVESRLDAAFTRAVFRQTLHEILRRLSSVRVVYPIPKRISLDESLRLIDDFLRERSGGDRYEALTTALLRALSQHFGLFHAVRRSRTTAADVSTGMVSDIECLDAAGTIVLAVEAKDRELTIAQVTDRIPGLRESGVTEAFFVASGGIRDGDAQPIGEVQRREFASGHNLYVTDLVSLARTLLALLGETGRRVFLECVCAELDENSEIRHRRAWADLLRTV